MTDIYKLYSDYVKTVCDTGDLSSFKSNPCYTYMLEHVSPEVGQKYLDCILKHTSITRNDIQEFADKNDRIGNTTRIMYDTIVASPTSLRYIYFAHLILTHLKAKQLPTYNLVEIGGGYGGLFLAVDFLHKRYDMNIESYTIIDLTEPGRLQQAYLSKHTTQIPYYTADASTYGSTLYRENQCLISTYSFSEISPDYQLNYINYLFPRIKHGFIAWNNIPTYYFGFHIQEEEENPKTGAFNKFVYF